MYELFLLSLKANICKSENYLLKAAVEDLRETVWSNSDHFEEWKEKTMNMQQKFSAILKYSCDKCGKTFVSNKNSKQPLEKIPQWRSTQRNSPQWYTFNWKWS